MNFSEFKEKFRISELVVAESTYWVASVRPVQVTLGALVISLKEPKTSMGEIRDEEGSDFFALVKRAELLNRQAFKHEKTNLLALMMVDPFIHFHFIPRYSEEIPFQGSRFSDCGWPGPPDLSGDPSSDLILNKIKGELVKHI